ncbi:MAG TPA: glycosyltransferase family 39 protein, partial [Pyrinomonadaceae bacterium]
MNALLLVASLVIGFGISFLVPSEGVPALLLCLALTLVACYLVASVELEKRFLLQVFLAALLMRLIIGTAIFFFSLQNFFGGDAITYDVLGQWAINIWEGKDTYENTLARYDVAWGMPYLVGVIYWVLGRNMLAVQFFNAILGAATAPIIFLCAQHIYGNLRVSRLATLFVAFYPSLALWSSQGLKDGPLVFLLAVSMLATLRLGERFNLKYLVILVASLLGIFSLRFYIFYIMLAAISVSFIIGMTALSAQGLVRQFIIIIAIGLAMTYLGVIQRVQTQVEIYGNAAAIQNIRADLTERSQSSFGKDVDVSTTGGALSAIPLGMLYLLFAPFPWQLASLRQSITFPEMVVWWVSFPVLVMGLWFTLKYRMRQALPILIFTTMLTLSYSVFQGN